MLHIDCTAVLVAGKSLSWRPAPEAEDNECCAKAGGCCALGGVRVPKCDRRHLLSWRLHPRGRIDFTTQRPGIIWRQLRPVPRWRWISRSLNPTSFKHRHRSLHTTPADSSSRRADRAARPPSAFL